MMDALFYGGLPHSLLGLNISPLKIAMEVPHFSTLLKLPIVVISLMQELRWSC